MEEIICYTKKIPPGQCQYIGFWDILLDDAWADGSFACASCIYQAVGNLNQRLRAKRNYEFLLRAALHFPVKAVGTARPPAGNCMSPLTAGNSGYPVETASLLHSSPETGKIGLSDPDEPETSPSETISPEEDSLESFRTDCYIVGKYQQMLLEEDCFNMVTATLLDLAGAMPWKEHGIAFLEKMISHAPEFYDIDDNTCPILLYKETDMCYNLLNRFVDQLEYCFLSRGQRVEVFDASAEGAQQLTQFIGRRFKAVLGIQSYLFSIKMQDGSNLHDLIHGPKYNLVMDHPAWLKDHLDNAPKDYCLLIHDRNYIRFVRRYFPNINSCLHFPLGGFLPDSGFMAEYMQKHMAQTETHPAAACKEKRYGITFIASYRNYRDRLKIIRKYDRRHRFLAARYLRIMKEQPNIPAENALRMALEHYHLKTEDSGFLSLFYDMRQVYFAILLYYREKVVRTLLDAGLTVHVFGESWQNIPFAGHPNLVCHPSAETYESLQIMQQSRISLNVMSWHKDGLTERVLNAMLCGSAVLTDQSTALAEEFENNTDILMFSLDKIEQLPARLIPLLSPGNESILQSIAENGRQKALQKHLWQHRADMLLDSWDT